MNENTIKDHLLFFKQNVVNLNDTEIYPIIENYFDRTVFLNNIEYLENNSLIVKDDNGNTIYSITEKGDKLLTKITKQLERESEKDRMAFEKSKIDLELAQKMLKEYPYTKWFARIGLTIAIILAALEILQL
jgi:predicted transcriptional regulator